MIFPGAIENKFNSIVLVKMWNGAAVNMGEGKQYTDPVLFAKEFGLYLEHSAKPQFTFIERLF